MGNNTNLESAYKITAILRRFPHLPRRWIQTLHGSPHYARKWLSQQRGKYLTNHPHSFSMRLPVAGSRYPRPREYSWMLTPSGHEFNGDRGYDFVPPGGHFKHQLASSFLGASFELATQEIEGLSLITPEHVLLSHHCPRETATKSNPWLISAHGLDMEADAPVFGLEYDHYKLYFFGFELDRSSESLSVVGQKFANYQKLIDHNLPRELYGIPQPYFPWVVKTNERKDHILTLIGKEIDSEHQHRFIVQVWPETVDFPEPSGRAVTDEWHTPKGPFNILTYIKEKARDRQSKVGQAGRVESVA